jgi:hypothetical protein
VSLTGDGSAHRPGSLAYMLTQAALGGDEEGEEGLGEGIGGEKKKSALAWIADTGVFLPDIGWVFYRYVNPSSSLTHAQGLTGCRNRCLSLWGDNHLLARTCTWRRLNDIEEADQRRNWISRKIFGMIPFCSTSFNTSDLVVPLVSLLFPSHSSTPSAHFSSSLSSAYGYDQSASFSC